MPGIGWAGSGIIPGGGMPGIGWAGGGIMPGIG
jgi:hypothetical protein